MSDEIVWQSPPEDRRRAGARRRFVEALKARPGEWAIYPSKTGHASAVACNFRKDFHGVETIVVNRVVYARWIGSEEAK